MSFCSVEIMDVREKSSRKEFKVAGLNAAVSHYTDAVRFGDLLFVSGIAALDQDMNLVGEDDVVAQAEQVFVNLEMVLREASAGFEDVLKVTVYLTDIEDRVRINPVRERYFGDARPASTLVEVSGLVMPGMKVEIEAIVGLHTGKIT